MLILTRRVGETLVIGSIVRVTVAGVRGNQIRIGIEAPKSVRVHREELYERIQRRGQNPREPRLVVPTIEPVVKGGTAAARRRETNARREPQTRSA